MGTSQTSPGSPSQVSLIPPWAADVNDSDDSEANEQDDTGQESNDESNPASEPNNLIAPRGRFGPARLNLNKFSTTGEKKHMRRGIGHYIKKGLGGKSNAVHRLGSTISTAGSLYGALSAVASGQSYEESLDPSLLTGKSANEIMDAVIEVVTPIDGTLDTEACRYSIREALSDLLNKFPDADLLSLSENQRNYAIERFIAFDIYSRIWLDLGKSLQDKAPNTSAALARFKEIRDYIKETVSASFRKLKQAGESIRTQNITSIVRKCLKETLTVFESYSK